LAGLVAAVAAVDPRSAGWVASGLLVAGAFVLGLTAGRADALAPARRGRLSSVALRWVVALAVVTPVAQFGMILTDLDVLGGPLGACLTVQSLAVIALITLPSIARGQERGGPLRS